MFCGYLLGGDAMNPLDINDAITLLKDVRSKSSGTSDFAWNTVYHAHQYLEAQLRAYFAPEDIKEAA